jgi:hypothetical protein
MKAFHNGIKDMALSAGQDLSLGKVISGAGIALILMAGWIFTLIISSQAHVRERQEQMAERIAHLEATVVLVVERVSLIRCKGKD